MPNEDKAMKEPIADLNAYLTDEPDPKLRAIVSLIYTLARANSDAAKATTKAITDMSQQLEIHLNAFEKHTSEELAIAEKGRGIRRMLVILGISLNIVIGSMLTYYYRDYSAMNRNIQELKEAAADNKAKLGVLERRIDVINDE